MQSEMDLYVISGLRKKIEELESENLGLRGLLANLEPETQERIKAAYGSGYETGYSHGHEDA